MCVQFEQGLIHTVKSVPLIRKYSTLNLWGIKKHAHSLCLLHILKKTFENFYFTISPSLTAGQQTDPPCEKFSSSAAETIRRGPATTQRGRGTSWAQPLAVSKGPIMWKMTSTGPSDQPSCQLKTTELPQSKPHKAKVSPNWALLEFSPHKLWDIMK